MHVLHVASRIDRSSAGVGAAVAGLVTAEVSLVGRVEIWTTDPDESIPDLDADLGLTRSAVKLHSVLGPRRLSWSPAMRSHLLGDRGHRFSVLHQHGLWTACSYVASSWSRKKRGAKVISLHGMLAGPALAHSRLRKGIALALYERRNLDSSDCLHAASALELADIREFGLRQPVCLIPNGISRQWLDSTGDPGRFRARFGLPRDRRIVLFLSRIAPIKGLRLLLSVLSEARHHLRDWMLVIAGMDCGGHRQELESALSVSPIASMCRFVGPLYGQSKRDAFAAADLFILPSRREAAPMALLEAIGAGVPVLTTCGTPWSDIGHNRCGWWVDLSEAALRETLCHAAALPRSVLYDMGTHARSIAASTFSWDIIAQQFVEVYRWLNGGSQRPATVTTY